MRWLVSSNSAPHFRIFPPNIWYLCGPHICLKMPHKTDMTDFLRSANACYWSISPSRAESVANPPLLSIDGTDRPTDGHPDARPFHGPCSAYYAGSVSKEQTLIPVGSAVHKCRQINREWVIRGKQFVHHTADTANSAVSAVWWTNKDC